jgi:glycosyltransferase involved in cell wall biosynthesis
MSSNPRVDLVSVAICTWNRAAELHRTLASFCELSIPSGLNWQLLIVNNNSTDETDQVIEDYASRLPIVRLFEPQQGISWARNRALEAAAGDLVVFTDDDVLVDPCWLRSYVEAASRWPQDAYFGGPIALAFDAPPPPLVARNLGWLKVHLGALDVSGAERSVARGDQFHGANMAFRRSALAGERFDARFGRVGAERVAGEETAFLFRLQEQGLEGVWVPEARIRHRVSMAQITTERLRKDFAGRGRTRVRMLRREPGGLPAKRQASFLVYHLAEKVMHSLVRVLSLDRSLYAVCRSAWVDGFLSEFRGAAFPSARD